MKGKSRKVERMEAYIQTEEGLEEVGKLIEKGLTKEEIAQHFGVSRTTFYRWINRYPDLDDVMFSSEEHLIDEAERSLYQKCFPHTITETRTHYDREGNIRRIVVIEKEIPASFQAIKFVLTHKAGWRDPGKKYDQKEDTQPGVLFLTPEEYKERYGVEYVPKDPPKKMYDVPEANDTPTECYGIGEDEKSRT